MIQKENDRIAELLALARLDAIHEALAMLTDGVESDSQAGRRALLLAFCIDRHLVGNQRDLARRLGVSQARASQMLKSMRKALSRKRALV